MKRLRYTLDVVVEYFKIGCPYDWNDVHFDDDNCPRCQRDRRRRMRIAHHHNTKLLPPARAL
jgi:hypothetical protein